MSDNVLFRISNKAARAFHKYRPPVRQKVFGIGLPKTGTTSLGRSFAILGFKHHSCDMNLALQVKKGQLGEALNRAKRYESFEDWPWFMLYKELYENFPGSKFILTTRKDPETYIDSLHRHRIRQGVFEDDYCPPVWWQGVFGRDPSYWNQEEIRLEYELHLEETMEFFSKSEERSRCFKVLNWEAGDSWPELCEFLQLQVPKAPFPHANQRIL